MDFESEDLDSSAREVEASINIHNAEAEARLVVEIDMGNGRNLCAQ